MKKDYNWNREDTRYAIDEAKISSVIEEVIVDGKISFEGMVKKSNLGEKKGKPPAGKATEASIAADFTDFKEHIWREISAIKVEVTQNQMSS